MIYAKVIADSISPLGCRLTSVELQFPRFILPQLLMHRQWSRSCESMRARPVASKIAEVRTSSVVPQFARNQSGMVAGERFSAAEQAVAEKLWKEAADTAALLAEKLAASGVAKQWANRLLEPFAYQKMLVTATDFANFFRLRLADDAQPEIQELAAKMKEVIDRSEPKTTTVHYPYIEDDERLSPVFDYLPPEDVSSARCARLSYCTHDGRRDCEKDVTLATKLRISGHSNPFEHVAYAAEDRRRYANYRGWVSYRYRLEKRGMLPNPKG